MKPTQSLLRSGACRVRLRWGTTARRGLPKGSGSGSGLGLGLGLGSEPSSRLGAKLTFGLGSGIALPLVLSLSLGIHGGCTGTGTLASGSPGDRRGNNGSTPDVVIRESDASTPHESSWQLAVGRSMVWVQVTQNDRPVVPNANDVLVMRPAPFEIQLRGDTDLVSLAALPSGATTDWWPQPGASLPMATFGGTASIFAGYVPMLQRPAELAPLEPEWFQQRWGTEPRRAGRLADHARARLGENARLLISPRAALAPSAANDDVTTIAITINGFNDQAIRPGQRTGLLVLLEDPIGERLFETRWLQLPLSFGAAD